MAHLLFKVPGLNYRPVVAGYQVPVSYVPADQVSGGICPPVQMDGWMVGWILCAG